MSSPKIKPTSSSVTTFLSSVENNRRRTDGFELLKIMKEITKEKPVLWGSSIVGFGLYHYKYKSGREGDTFMVGFSPRKKSLSVYLSVYLKQGISQYNSLFEKLGKHKLGKACLYINKLEDVDMDILREIISRTFEDIKKD